MKWNSIIALCLTLIFASCGKKQTQSTKAPRTKDQVGIIASCVDKSQAETIARELEIQYRVLSEKRKIIEFIGADQQELKKQLPKSKFKPNKLIKDVLISGDFKAQNVGNVPFFGPHSPTYGDEYTARSFPHLKQVEAINSAYQGEDVIIAIIDTGVYYNHPHLSSNILVNSIEVHGNERDYIDQDENGYRDDYVGWDFYNGDAYPIDDNGHGTHVAGLAAGTLMGIAPKAKILPVKVLGSSGQGDLATIAAGIMYALDRGADVINLSLGGPGGNQISAEVQNVVNIIQMAQKSNAMIVAAAGNGGSDGIGDCNDSSPVYPANIQEENLISVASVNLYNELTEYSNYGSSTVHIAAPGGDVYTGALSSTGIPFCEQECGADDIVYANSMGTSMATPIVSGVIAAMKSKAPNLGFKMIKEKILNNSKKIKELQNYVQSSSVISLSKILDSI